MPAAPVGAHHPTEPSSLPHVDHLEVVLLPGGLVARSGTEPDPEATWEVLGHTWETGTAKGFLRVELGGASWAAFIAQERLTQIETGLRVRVRRQSSVQRDPLVGWTLFC
jgi:hypothetical protein